MATTNPTSYNIARKQLQDTQVRTTLYHRKSITMRIIHSLTRRIPKKIMH